MFNVKKFLGIEPNDIQRRVFISSMVFGGTFILDMALIISFGLIGRGLKILNAFANYHPFSPERIVIFVLILSVGVFLSLVYYVILPMGPPPRVEEIFGEYSDY